MRPETFFAPWREAFRKGFRAGRESLSAMLAIEAVMAIVVVSYYYWPAAAKVMAVLAHWQQAGGVLGAALASAIAGGFISEVSAVYFQDGGRWTRTHVENAGCKMVLFFITGAVVFKFYEQQAVWFGNGTAWSVLVPKILVDQFIYTPFWSVTIQSLATRWQALNFSGSRLRRELNARFVRERMLPLLAINWMFWIPGVTFIYVMPQTLQMPLALFANAIWGLLLSATARQPVHPSGTVQDLVLPDGEVAPLAD